MGSNVNRKMIPRSRRTLGTTKHVLVLLLTFFGRQCRSWTTPRIQHYHRRHLSVQSQYYLAQGRQGNSLSHTLQTRSLTQCHGTKRFHNDGDGDGGDNVVKEFLARNMYSGWLLLLTPAALALVAFSTHPQVAEGFRDFVDVVSGHTWAPVDGGETLTDLIAPALTGPVASFISLLFGTLTSMTVGQLYSRQANIAKLLGELLEDLRLLELHATQLPTPAYREECKRNVLAYGALVVEILEDGGVFSKKELLERREAGRRLLEQTMGLLHRVSGDKSVAGNLNGRALDEAYGTINRLIRTRSSIVTTFANAFPIWHYGNLCILGLAILFIFLVLTDKTALLFLGGFQLRMCWAMLIGTLSMLLVVIVDLNSPLSGAFQIVKPVSLVDFELDEYVEAVSGANNPDRNSTEIRDFLS